MITAIHGFPVLHNGMYSSNGINKDIDKVVMGVIRIISQSLCVEILHSSPRSEIRNYLFYNRLTLGNG